MISIHIKITSAEEVSSSLKTVRTPPDMKPGDIVHIYPITPAFDSLWGTLTHCIDPKENEWGYDPITLQELSDILAQRVGVKDPDEPGYEVFRYILRDLHTAFQQDNRAAHIPAS